MMDTKTSHVRAEDTQAHHTIDGGFPINLDRTNDLERS